MAAAICASWRSSLRWIRNERTLRSSFTSRLNLVAGDRVPGSLIHLALQCGRAVSFAAAYHRLGFCRWAVESADGRFLGYAGIMPSSPDHPLGNHFEIGWRLVRSAWGTDMLLRRRGQHSETPSRML